MAQPVFMRGVIELDRLIACYLVAQSGDAYYIYYNPPPGDTTDQAVFASESYSQGGPYVPRQVFIQRSGTPATYTLRARQNTGSSIANLVAGEWTVDDTTTTNVLDVSPDVGAPGTSMELIPAPGYRGVDPRQIYAGVWYIPYNSQGRLRFKTQALGNGGSAFRGATGELQPSDENDFKIMFIPQDNGSGGPIGIWVNATCQVPVPDQAATASIIYFNSWAIGDLINGPSNCDVNGWATADNRRCLFVSLDDCNQQYLYPYCDTGQRCGPACFGVCPADPDNGVVPFCEHDYTSQLKRDGLSPLSCDPLEPEPPTVWEQYWGLFLALIIIVLVFIIALGAMIYYANRSRRTLI